jgi:hypothetical protein
MANRLFSIGIVAGLAAALALAGMFSALSDHSAAQMMGGDHMGNRMTSIQTFGQDAPWSWTKKASFSATGTSNVENVQVSGVSITSDNQVSVNVMYDGNGTTPAIVIIASSDLIQGAGMMPHGMMGSMGAMPVGQGTMFSGQNRAWNNTQWQQWHSQMAELHANMNGANLPGMEQLHNQMFANPNMMMASMTSAHQNPMWGGMALQSGWSSNTPFIVTFSGGGSAYDANNVSVMIYPLTS